MVAGDVRGGQRGNGAALVDLEGRGEGSEVRRGSGNAYIGQGRARECSRELGRHDNGGAGELASRARRWRLNSNAIGRGRGTGEMTAWTRASYLKRRGLEKGRKQTTTGSGTLQSEW